MPTPEASKTVAGDRRFCDHRFSNDKSIDAGGVAERVNRLLLCDASGVDLGSGCENRWSPEKRRRTGYRL